MVMGLVWFTPAGSISDATNGFDLAVTEIRDLLTRGQFEEAEARARPLLERAETQYGEIAPEVAEVLDLIVEAQLQSGRAKDSTTHVLAERADAIWSQAVPPDDIRRVPSLRHKAQILRAMADFDEAQLTYQYIVEVSRQSLPSDDPKIAQALSELAELLAEIGYYAQARPFFEQALTILETSSNPDDLEIARLVRELGILHEGMGNLDEAWDHYYRALVIREQTLGSADPSTATSQSDLARLLRLSGDLNRSRVIFENVLRIQEDALGRDHPEVARVRNELGDLLLVMGSDESAGRIVNQSLALHHTSLGAVRQSPDALARAGPGGTGEVNEMEWAQTLRNTAGYLERDGDLEGAKRAYSRVLGALRSSVGEEHPLVARSLIDLAQVNYKLDALDASLGDALLAERISRVNLLLAARAMTEQQALSAASERATGLDIALLVAVAAQDSQNSREVWDAVVRSRALILDAIANRNRTIQLAKNLAELQAKKLEAGTRLANIRFRRTTNGDLSRYRELLAAAERDYQKVQEAIAESHEILIRELTREEIGLADVTGLMGPSDALVAFVRYDNLDRERRYMAFTQMGASGPAQAIDLGYAEEVDQLVLEWWADITSPTRSTEFAAAGSTQPGEKLRLRLWEPLSATLQGAKKVFIVPDGVIHLVNFACLPSGEQTYVVETGPTVHYLSAERDLALPGRKPLAGEGLLAMGDPAFDDASAFRPASAVGGSQAKIAMSPAMDQVFRGNPPSCQEFLAHEFPRLSDAGREVEEITSLWSKRQSGAGDAVVLTGAEATETAFKQMAPGRGVLHIATHGFFLGGACESWIIDTRGIGRLAPSKTSKAYQEMGENPLLLCGLAMAGANRRASTPEDSDDGVLTAEEISALDLSGVEWTVLSACGTGLGELSTGEGVFGLRRAFQVAGANTLILSLWPVEDQAARDWMRHLYAARFVDGLSTDAAVREASVRMLKEERSKPDGKTHPFFWGAFVATGNWR
jgi:CHAT domain-containing protein